MNLQPLIDQLIAFPDDRTAMESVRQLSTHTDDVQVMSALCALAVKAVSHALRNVLIDVLSANPAGAVIRFSDYALWSQNPSERKWALVNLSLMGCREAQDAVISGLYDPDPSVRQAAALSTGLYNDCGVQTALGHCIENLRLDMATAGLDGDLYFRKKKDPPLDDDISMKTIFL